MAVDYGTFVSAVVGVDGDLGSERDWVQSVLGQKIFGEHAKGYVSVEEGVGKAMVRLPFVRSDADASSIAQMLRVAGGVALRGGYPVFDDGEVSNCSSASPLLGSPSVGANLNRGADASCKYDDGSQAGELLALMNEAVVERAGLSRGQTVASGFCYEILFKLEFRKEAVAALGRWPILSEVVGMPVSWFADAAELLRVGVSLRGGDLHFQLGWGDGALSAHDVLVFARRGKLMNGNPRITELMNKRVGGESKICKVEDCRREVLEDVDLSRLAIWGDDLTALKASPGWSLFFAACNSSEDEAVKVISTHFGLTTELCRCWHDVPAPAEGLKPCDNCGFMVRPAGHDARCKLKARPVVVAGSDRKRAAWLGDGQHTLDVRKMLLKYFGYSEAVRLVEKYTSGVAQCAYLLDRGVSHDGIADGSEWFESEYSSFQDEYLQWLEVDVGALAGDVISDDGTSSVSRSLTTVSLEDGKLNSLLVAARANDKAAVLSLLGGCSLREFQVVEACVVSLNVPGHVTAEVVSSCRPVQAGPLAGDAFKSLVQRWFDTGTVSEALARVVRGRAVACIGKRATMRILAEIR